jgi:hypothetical protein
MSENKLMSFSTGRHLAGQLLKKQSRACLRWALWMSEQSIRYERRAKNDFSFAAKHNLSSTQQEVCRLWRVWPEMMVSSEKSSDVGASAAKQRKGNDGLAIASSNRLLIGKVVRIAKRKQLKRRGKQRTHCRGCRLWTKRKNNTQNKMAAA